MKRSYFCPDSFLPSPAVMEWAIKTFNVDHQEVLRQVELMKDHEFRRPYSDWTRVFRNWMRKAEQIQSLKRERTYNRPAEPTAEELERDRLAFERDMRRLKVVK